MNVNKNPVITVSKSTKKINFKNRCECFSSNWCLQGLTWDGLLWGAGQTQAVSCSRLSDTLLRKASFIVKEMFYSWKLFKQTICPWDGHRFSSRQEFPSVWAVLPCLFLRELVDSRTCVELYIEFSVTRDFLTSVRQSRWSWGPLKISGNLLTHSYKGPGQKSWNEYSILPSTSYSGHVLVSHLVPNSPPHVHHLGKKRGNDCF